MDANLKRLFDTTSRLTISESDPKTIKIPAKSIILRDYQIYGVHWLLKCVAQSRGGILCDEMGLGKTCQLITFLSTLLLERTSSQHILLVAPLSVMEHWSTELERFAPGSRFIVYYGDKNMRSAIRDKFLSTPHQILLTTYELCINDEEFLGSVKWNILVVDEGHRVKNKDTILYQVLTKVCSGLRFILTGTPVQNNLDELYNILHFVAPNYFTTSLRKTFIDYFNASSRNDQRNRDTTLTTILRPFLLRRTKDQVLTHLPARRDVLIYHPITSLQTRIYRALLTRNADVFSLVVDGIDPNGNRKAIPARRLGNLIIQLQKCVDHPYLFDGIEQEPFVLGPHLIQTSGKLQLLDSLLDFLYNKPHKEEKEAATGGASTISTKPAHKVLIFSQMTRMLDIVQDYLTLKGYSYERLDGSIRGQDRFQAIEGFNQDEETFVFLLSTKAGGQGLNLVAADTVVLLDSDFNPQNDIQASARAHRIGQTKPVRVIRLVGRDTVEEAILSRADAKLKLTSRVLRSSDSTSDPCADNTDAKTTEDDGVVDLRNVLKFALYRLFEDLKVDDDSVEDTVVNNDVSLVTRPDFAAILGDTDPNTSHWIPPVEELGTFDNFNTQSDNVDLSYKRGWVVLTDKPFECKSTDDQMAAQKLREAYKTLNEMGESIGSPLNQTNRGGGGSSGGHRKQLTEEEKLERARKLAESKALRLKRQEERSAKRRQDRQKKWETFGYRTMSVFSDDSSRDEINVLARGLQLDVDSDSEVEYIERNRGLTPGNSPGIHYVIGDASDPLNDFGGDRHACGPSIICVSVDQSGLWGRGGFFAAVNSRTPKPREAYELAGSMDDLVLGSCHLIPILRNQSSSSIDIPTFTDYVQVKNQSHAPNVNFCALLVVQKHSGNGHSSGEPPRLQLNMLECSLRALAKACIKLGHCTVHLPRIGHGTQAFTWYSVERIVRKYLVDRAHIPVYVYYYSRGISKTPAGTVTDTRQNQTTIPTTSSTPPKRTSVESNALVHSDPKRPRTAGSQARHLKDLFTGKVFFLWPDENSSTVTEVSSNTCSLDRGRKNLHRIIVANNGVLAAKLTHDVTHIICLSTVPSIPNDFQSIPVVSGSWIFDSLKESRCIPGSCHAVT